ncbi:MAG: SemiSWEET family sugar transporter [Dissulfurispiraceae bacterium]|jgi:MtN3 and saliva related transmembrane protein
MDTTTILGYAAGILTTMSLVPQVIKIWRMKSARNVSLGMFLIFSVGISLWIAYGFSIHSMPVIIANTVSLLLGFIVLWLKFKFHGR